MERRTTRWLFLCLGLLVASPALAQRVVILEIKGDTSGRLRNQVDAALKRANTVEVVAIDNYRAAAAKKKLNGTAAMVPEALKKVAPGLRLSAAVGGQVSKKAFSVQIWDGTGQALWSKEIKIRNGLLTADFAQKLAKAITAAARTAPKIDETATDAEEGETEKPPETDPAPKKDAPVQNASRPPETTNEEGSKALKPSDSSVVASEEPPPVDQDLESEGAKKPRTFIGPKGLTVWVAGTTTWRSYCARPGVSSCGEFDALPEPKPQGDVVNLSPQVPYLGFEIQAEIFPLAWVLDNFLKGLGLVGGIGVGFSRLDVIEESSSGTSTPKRVVALDRVWNLGLTYRYYFSFNKAAKEPLSGYVGLRFGAAQRVFQIDAGLARILGVDAPEQVALPGTQRLYPQVAIDAALPIHRLFVVELSGSFLISPRPGPDEIASYGNIEARSGGASTLGFGVAGGASGHLWGPIGYRINARYHAYFDQFFGTGQKWVYTTKGAAAESYVALLWGLTFSI